MRPRSLLFFSSLLVLASSCAKASSTGGEGGDSSGPGGEPTTGSPTTGSNTTSGVNTTGSDATSSTGTDVTSTGSSPTSTGSNVTSTSSGPSCPDDPCKLTLPQCGCAAGEQCSVDGSGRACIPTGSTQNGQSCAGPDCAPGLLCVNTSDTVSTCGKFCDDDGDCTAPGGLCIIGLNDGSGNAIPGVTMCTENCDPTTNVGCPAAGTSCQVAQESAGQMRFLTHCDGAGNKQQGATCVTNADCAPTFGCYRISTGPDVFQCLKNCKMSTQSCPAGAQCLFFQTPELVGNEEYGACLSP
jgi:hypothetical protein